jgi:CubicO group peptidase (beta-lactamase class C family)
MSTLGFPTKIVLKGPVATKLIDDINKPLPDTFTNDQGTILKTREFLHDHWTTGLVILKVEDTTSAKLVYEEYFRGNTKDSLVISWSTAKSIIGSLIGIAITENTIHNVHDKVTMYVPELEESGYGQCTIKQVLQMSSGVNFDENYFNPFSDINKLGYLMSFGGSVNAFVSSLKNRYLSGTYHNYISSDTQILAMVLQRATGMSIADYMETKLWQPLGASKNAYWLLDNNKDHMELAFGGFNACTRDFALIGWLYLNKGLSPLNGKRIIDAGYIEDSVTPDAPHLRPGVRPGSKEILGYGYQWWVPEHNDTFPDDYLAIGVYNQFIYVNPSLRIIIARNSAYPFYSQNEVRSEMDAIACFRRLAIHFSESV